MEIEVYKQVKGFEYESIAIFDSWKSLTIYRNYYTCNKFELVVPLSFENVRMFITDTALRMNNINYYIDDVSCDDVNSGLLKITGKSFLGKVNERIIWRTYNVNKKAELICVDLLNNEVIKPSVAARKIDYLKLKDTQGLTTNNVSYQNSYGVVLEEIEKLCATYDFGISEVADNQNSVSNVVEFYKGKDVSDNVVFSIEFEDLLNESYENNTYDERNVALVLGEGEGSARKSVTLNNDKSGLNRKELHVDARDLRQEDDDKRMSDAEYLNVLKARGNSKLSEHQAVLSITGEIDTRSDLFIYGKDYDLGSRVSIQSKLFNVDSKKTITSIKETYDDKGIYVEPSFGKETVTLLDLIRRV